MKTVLDDYNVTAMERYTEFLLLAKFVLACQNPLVSRAADAQGLTTSALSTALRSLEKRLDIKLFVRQGRHLGLLPSAFWLYRDACALLHLENQAREAARLPSGGLEKLVVNIDMSFVIGRFSKALDRAIQKMGKLHPKTLVDCRFSGGVNTVARESIASDLFDSIPKERTGQIEIFYYPELQMSDYTFARVLYEDPWQAVSVAPETAAPKMATDQLVVTRMKPALMEAIHRYSEIHGLGNQLHHIDADPFELGRVMTEHPNLRLLMPTSMLATRLGLKQLHTTPLSPPLVSRVGSSVRGALNDKASVFLELLRESLKEPEANIVFTPKMTMRQIHLFNLACQSGGISGAARVAQLAQPSVSDQIHKLEDAFALPLLLRSSGGAAISQTGSQLLPFTLELVNRHSFMLRKARDVAAHTQASVSLGSLPSSGHDSALTALVAETITRIHRQYPSWRMQLSEASNTVLNEKVRAGALNLAIVGMIGPQVGRIALGPGEALSVAANPAIDFGGQKSLSLEAVSRLPLVLGARHLSIHQGVAMAMRARNLSMKPAVEVGSLALAIAMARRAPLCTILPASSVRRDVEDGHLITIPIDAPDISGGLFVIFSMERALSEAERVIIQVLIDVFGASENE